MSKLRKLILILVSLVIVINCIGCANKKNEGPNDKDPGYCVINGKTITFLADEEKERLREPLIKLLSNETHEVFDENSREESIGYEPYDPNEPTVPEGYSCGLYDVTSDGMPELLIFPKGYSGSSGTVTYFVYDIFSGAYLGSINGNISESLCVYYFTEIDELRSVASYSRSKGWAKQYHFTTFLKFNKDNNTCYEELYLYLYYEVKGEIVSTSEVGDDGTYSGQWVESYHNEKFKVHGKDASSDDYNKEIEWFYTNCIRIPETELQMIKWHDACSDKNRFVRAEKMVDALLSTTQKFIVPFD